MTTYKLPTDEELEEMSRCGVFARPVPPPSEAPGVAPPPDHDARTHRAAARNPSLPANAARDLASSPHTAVRVAVAESKHTDYFLLEQLANDKSWYVRRAVAANPATPLYTLAGILRAYADDEAPESSDNWRLRRVVATNPALSASLVETLAADTRIGVRAAAAAHPNMPAEQLVRLAGDKAVAVRAAVAANAAAPPEALRRLITSAATAFDEDRYMLVRVARHPATDSDTLRSLAELGPTGTTRDIWYAVIANPNTPPDIVTAALQSATASPEPMRL